MSSKEMKNRITKTGGRFIVWTLAAVLAAAMAVGDVESTGNEEVYAVEVIPSARAAQISEPTVEQVGPGPTIQSLSFKKDMSIRDALRFLAAKYRKNIVPSTGVDGIVTVTSLYDITFEQALQAILGYGFKYDQEGNFIRVYTTAQYKKIKEDPDGMLHKVFTLYYITAEEAAKLCRPVLSNAAIMQASTSTETGISTVKEGVGSETGGNSMALHDTIVIHDFPENIAKAEKLIASIDVRPQQVLIEATILSVTLTDGMEFGIDWNLLGGVTLNGTAATQDLVTDNAISRGTAATAPITQIAAGAFAGTPMETFGFASKTASSGLRIGITSGNLSAILTALETTTEITVLANPKILALNKQAGTVFIGQRLGYRDRTTISDTGQATVGEVRFLTAGTKLSFRPFIGNDGYIRMEIYPKDSIGELDAEGIPAETTAELMTNIMVKDGETIVIGGLFRDAITTSRSQIPLLGDLPLIGAAFRGTNDKSVRQEVIIILTPHIIKDTAELADATEIKDVKLITEGAHKSLSIINRTRILEDRLEIAGRYFKDGYYQAALAELNAILEVRPNYPDAMRLREKVLEKLAEIQ